MCHPHLRNENFDYSLLPLGIVRVARAMGNKGVLWQYFHRGEKQNANQYRAYCLACSEHDDLSDDGTPVAAPAASRSKFLSASLATLFGGDGAARPVETTGMRTRQHPVLDEEARLMELLGAEYSDEPPDDGELEGSGNDFTA